MARDRAYSVPHFGTLHQERGYFVRVLKSARKNLRQLQAQQPMPGFQRSHEQKISDLEAKIKFYDTRLKDVNGKISRLN